MQYSILPISDVSDHGFSFWQSKYWAKILQESHQVEEVFYFGNIEYGYILVEIRSIGGGFFGAFSLGVKKSQLPYDPTEHITALKVWLLGHGVVFLQMEPLEELLLPFSGHWLIGKKFLTPYTQILDLSFSQEHLLSQMHEKGRYNIRLAQKRGVVVEQVSVYRDGNLDIWMNLLSDTLERDKFSGNSSEYYESFIMEIEKNNRGGLYFARFEGRVIAAGIFVFTQERAIYYYGASSSDREDRKQMAPYLLQWNAICEAKLRQITRYDFLGVASPGKQTDPLRGVTDFKEKFGGLCIQLPQKALLVISPRYYIFVVLQKIKNLLKRR